MLPLKSQYVYLELGTELCLNRISGTLDGFAIKIYFVTVKVQSPIRLSHVCFVTTSKYSNTLNHDRLNGKHSSSKVKTMCSMSFSASVPQIHVCCSQMLRRHGYVL